MLELYQQWNPSSGCVARLLNPPDTRSLPIAGFSNCLPNPDRLRPATMQCMNYLPDTLLSQLAIYTNMYKKVLRQSGPKAQKLRNYSCRGRSGHEKRLRALPAGTAGRIKRVCSIRSSRPSLLSFSPLHHLCLQQTRQARHIHRQFLVCSGSGD